MQSASTPIKTINYIANNEAPSSHRLIILLPGIGDRAKAFEKHGIVDAIKNSHAGFDVISVEAHFKYYQNRSLVERIHQDIVVPATEKGYKEIIVAGVSLGGLGALLYLKHYPEFVSKTILLAPYLGEQDEYQYLIDSTEPKPTSFDIGLWPWITQLPEQQKEKIFLSYGQQDKFAIPNTLLSQYIPQHHTFTADGKHLWRSWRVLWPEVFSLAVGDP